MDQIDRRAPGADDAPRARGWLDKRRMIAARDFNRWRAPPAALAVHLSIGMAYGFSVFWIPLSRALPGVESCAAATSWVGELTARCNWRVESLNITFMLFTVMLGISAALFGRWVDRAGPRKAAVVAAVLWSSGLALGALAVKIHQLWLLWLGTGVIGGIGLGLGYISPISILIRWFPDRRGMATGLAVMGFGGGALVGAPLATALMKHFQTPGDNGVSATFIVLAVIYGASMLAGALSYRLPRRGWRPANWEGPTASEVSGRSVHVSTAWRDPSFWYVWGALCALVSAGLGMLSMAVPMLQEIFGGRLLGVDSDLMSMTSDQRAQIALVAVGFTGLLSLFNIAGRLFWAIVSDRIGRRNTYFCFFLISIPAYAALPALANAGQVALFVITACLILSTFGGAFAVIPAYISDLFGPQMVSAIQGRMMTAWSTAGVIGSLLMSTLHRGSSAGGAAGAHAFDIAFYTISALLVVGLICNTRVKPLADEDFMKDDDPEHQASMVMLTGVYKAVAVPPQVRKFATAASWLPVCVPMGWGVWITLNRLTLLL
jgi:MFS family permease